MFVTYSARTYQIRPPSDSDEPYSDQGSSGVDVTLNSIHASAPSGPHENCERAIYGCESIAPGDAAYVVLVVYEDGDTFGSSGYWCVAAVCSTPESAHAVTLRCEGANDLDRPVYRPWDGYFAHLNAATVVPLTVLM